MVFKSELRGFWVQRVRYLKGRTLLGLVSGFSFHSRISNGGLKYIILNKTHVFINKLLM